MQATPLLEVIVLAAGQGKRMASATPKVLHPVAGQPMLHHVLDTLATLNPSRIHIVVGHQADRVRTETETAYLGQVAPPRTWVLQASQLGTGHAVMQALPGVAPSFGGCSDDDAPYRRSHRFDCEMDHTLKRDSQ